MASATPVTKDDTSILLVELRAGLLADFTLSIDNLSSKLDATQSAVKDHGQLWKRRVLKSTNVWTNLRLNALSFTRTVNDLNPGWWIWKDAADGRIYEL